MAMVLRLVMMVTETGPSKFKAGTDASNASAAGRITQKKIIATTTPSTMPVGNSRQTDG